MPKRSPTSAELEISLRWMAGVVAVALAVGGGVHLAGGLASPVLDSALVRIQALSDPDDAREDSVRELGKSHDPQGLAMLIAVARQDRDERMRRRAVRALGNLEGGAGVHALIDIAHTHPSPEVRREAVKTVGAVAPTNVALIELQVITHRDGDEGVQRQAVDALGHLHTPQTLVPLAHLARAHASPAVREQALKQYAKVAAPEAALKLLTDRLANDPASTVQEEAVERLAMLPDGIGIPAVVDAARHHPVPGVRREAEERLAKR